MEFEAERPLIPPAPRPVLVPQTVTFPVSRSVFLQGAEAVIPHLVHPHTGQAWEYDGYRRTELYLVQPPYAPLGLMEHTVEFDLQFTATQTVVSVRTNSPLVQQLFNDFTRSLALFLLQKLRR